MANETERFKTVLIFLDALSWLSDSIYILNNFFNYYIADFSNHKQIFAHILNIT